MLREATSAMRRNVARKSDQSVTTGAATARKWYPESVVAPGSIAIGSGPAGLSAAETFRSRHPHIPVCILATDPAVSKSAQRRCKSPQPRQ
jgi:3-phenylpropionate/trans-cinnamate dioxygenase ferredoxin reductase subunit